MQRTDIQVRFNDVDQMGHVNNAVIMEYFDLGKEAFFMIVHYDVDFKRQIHFHDRIHVTTETERLGTKSVTVLQRVVDSNNGDICAECHTVLAGYRRSTGTSAVIPDDVRQRLSE